jgi:hypothetical protein
MRPVRPPSEIAIVFRVDFTLGAQPVVKRRSILAASGIIDFVRSSGDPMHPRIGRSRRILRRWQRGSNV